MGSWILWVLFGLASCWAIQHKLSVKITRLAIRTDIVNKPASIPFFIANIVAAVFFGFFVTFAGWWWLVGFLLWIVGMAPYGISLKINEQIETEDMLKEAEEYDAKLIAESIKKSEEEQSKEDCY